jgi:Ca2+-binding EF-hand superfamily protein
LCSKIAQKLGTSKDEVYEEMIQRYSDFDKNEDGYITVTMLGRIPIDKLGGHWRIIKHEKGFNSYMRLVGSSEMDSAQMARLLDGVISEAKELGITTETPDEIERMKALWKA